MKLGLVSDPKTKKPASSAIAPGGALQQAQNFAFNQDL
jgi:hypothetical protein